LKYGKEIKKREMAVEQKGYKQKKINEIWFLYTLKTREIFYGKRKAIPDMLEKIMDEEIEKRKIAIDKETKKDLVEIARGFFLEHIFSYEAKARGFEPKENLAYLLLEIMEKYLNCSLKEEIRMINCDIKKMLGNKVGENEIANAILEKYSAFTTTSILSKKSITLNELPDYVVAKTTRKITDNYFSISKKQLVK